ncbi:hypothetical protein EDD22DRAFT_952979 [Suillus occidentalis]|nr:hypothetical protein EDD22DRAFT_952979 [Suillus occidentalis]
MPTPKFHGCSNDAAFDTDPPPHPLAPTMPSSIPGPSISMVVTVPLAPAVPDQIFLTPIVPQQVNRYGRNVRVKDKYEAFLIKKGPLDCTEELAPVAGWEPLAQPEGALIFYHPYERVFTDADARDPETAVKLGKAVEKAKEEAGNAEIILNPYFELALELITKKDGEWVWGYYFDDHKKRVVFWFEDHMSDFLMGGVRGVERKSHAKYALESQYWKHVELFPNKRLLPVDVVLELKELVLFAQADGITSQTSLTRFTLAQIASIVSLVDLLRDSTEKERVHSVWITARFMKHLCRTKFVNFCGQPGARLDVDQSLYEESNAYSKNILFHVMNFILLGSPDAQSKVFRKVLVDEHIVDQRWEQYMDKLNSDWNEYTIFSTVMLAVDISFLAVQSVQTQPPVILLSYMSTLCAMGSLVVTLLLVGQVNKYLRGSRTVMAAFLVGMSGSVFGIESFPLMLSLPFGLLIWGIILFAAALSTLILRTPGIIIVSIAYPMWVAIVVLAIWPLLAANGIHVGSFVWYWITKIHVPHPWHRNIENVSRTATSPSHV